MKHTLSVACTHIYILIHTPYAYVTHALLLVVYIVYFMCTIYMSVCIHNLTHTYTIYSPTYTHTMHPMSLISTHSLYRYKLQQTEISGELNFHAINFVRVDCNSLRESLLNHCSQFQGRLTGLLNQNGATELTAVVDTFVAGKVDLTTPPTNLEELSAKLALYKQYKEVYATIQSKFEPIRNIYSTLIKADVTIREDELNQLTSLDPLYEEFGTLIAETQVALEKNKGVMKRDLDGQLEAYGAQMGDLKALSQTELPFGTTAKSTAEALKIIESYKQKIQAAKAQEAQLAHGLQIFGIASSEHKELTSIIKEVDLLSQIWTIRSDWEASWDQWKTCEFKDLDVESMEAVIGSSTKKVGRLGKEMRQYKAWEAMKADIDQFRDTIPLIQDLRSKALRARHWEQMQERVGDFDPFSKDFNLNQVVSMGFYNHKDFIGELAGNANKELAIEKALDELQVRWSTIELDLGPYKDK